MFSVPRQSRLAPSAADGMGIVKTEGETFTLMCNHEILGAGGGFTAAIGGPF